MVREQSLIGNGKKECGGSLRFYVFRERWLTGVGGEVYWLVDEVEALMASPYSIIRSGS
jgi:hypothetical protein